MATQSTPLPVVQATHGIDNAGEWFWNFLKQELTPYPGRAWVVGRVTISATIVMLLVMTFRIPGGFLGAIFTVFISRENPTATFRSGVLTILAFLVGAAYIAVVVRLFQADPMTHFLWVAASLFLSFYLIRIFADYGTAVAFGFMIAGSIPLWDETTLSVNDRMENTLWTAYAVVIGVVVSIVVEYVFRRVHPITDLTEGIESRLQTVEGVLRATAETRPLDEGTQKKLTLYSTVGTSRLRRLILRSDYSPHFKSQMSAAIALLGRLVDTAASFELSINERNQHDEGAIGEDDRKRCTQLADQIATLSVDMKQRQLPQQLDVASQPGPSGLRFLPSLEMTAALIPKVFSGSTSVDELVAAPLDEENPARIFVPDAFTSSAHLQFALRGTLAAMLAYVVYTALDWPGISTSLATCFITALSTIGSSRQKQFLRLSGAALGGFVFGMGGQIFVLPYLDTIFGFTILFAVVTAISAWIATASARLSYLGVQVALAFYLINLQEFAIQTSLSIARDRVVGVLLGLVCMWLLFDRLWVRNSLDEMQAIFARNLEMFAELAEQLLEPDQMKAIRRIRQLRDQLNAGFQAVNAQADAVLFEFGPSRERKMRIREDIQRWQPSIRTLMLVQVTSAQYLMQKPLKDMAEPISLAGVAFETDIAQVMRELANEVAGKQLKPVPDVRDSASRFNQSVRDYYSAPGVSLPPQAADVIGLAESLASILGPLYDDVHATFARGVTDADVAVAR